MAFNRKKYFQEKRILSFEGLDTINTEWENAKISRFSFQKRKSRNGKKLIEEWVPTYRIPEGYKNPYEKDVLHSHGKRCQLCDTPVTKYGIILHPKKKYFLIVGSECYELYENDSDRDLKLKLLLDAKSEYFEKLINEEKDCIRELLDKSMNTPDFYYGSDYAAYSTIKRDRWLAWSKTKFNNFIAKHAVYLDKIGYEPLESLSPKKYVEFYKNLATHYIGVKTKEYLKELFEEYKNERKRVPESEKELLNYYFYNITYLSNFLTHKRKKERKFSLRFYSLKNNLLSSIKKLDVENLKRIPTEEFAIEKIYGSFSDWKVQREL